MVVTDLIFSINIKQIIQQQHCFFPVLFFVRLMKVFSSGICKPSNDIVLARTILCQSLHQNSCCENVRSLYFFFRFLSVCLNQHPSKTPLHSFELRLSSNEIFWFWVLTAVPPVTEKLMMMMRLMMKTWRKKKQKNFLRRFEKWKKQKFDDECARVTEKKKKKMHKKK